MDFLLYDKSEFKFTSLQNSIKMQLLKPRYLNQSKTSVKWLLEHDAVFSRKITSSYEVHKHKKLSLHRRKPTDDFIEIYYLV